MFFGGRMFTVPIHLLEVSLVMFVLVLALAAAVGHNLNTHEKASTATIPGISWVFVVGNILFFVHKSDGKFFQVALILTLGSLLAVAAGGILSKRKCGG